jgi:mono/diheme cytochrome c family protein
MRRFVILGFAVVFVLAGLAALAGGDVEAGKAVYNKKCATCHGKDGMAKPAMAKMFKVEMRHLGSPEVQAKSDEQLRKESIEGVGKMKPVKGLKDADVDNLMAFLRTLKQE